MMRTTDAYECLSLMIFHGLCCEFGAGPPDSEPYRSPDSPEILSLTVSHYILSTEIFFLLESYLRL